MGDSPAKEVSYPQGAILLLDGKISGITSEAIRFLGGKKKEDLLGKKWSNFFHPSDRKEIKKLLNSPINNIFLKKRIITLQGEEIEMDIFITPMKSINDNAFLMLLQSPKEETKIVQNIIYKLKKRVDELECLYKMDTLARKNVSIEKMMEEICGSIRNLLQHPELSYCRISLKGKDYLSPARIGKVGGKSLKEEIIINGKKEGFLEVGYIAEVPSQEEKIFLKEEEEILHEIALKMGEIISYMELKEELERNRIYFKTILEKSSDITMVVDENAVVKFITPSVEELLGFSPEELIGKSALAFVHPDDMKIVSWHHQRMLENHGESVEAIYRVRTKDGRWKTFSITGRDLLHDATVEGLVINFHDITEIVKAERKLEENERKLRSMLNATHDMVLLTRVDENNFGKIVELNEAMAKALGKTREEILGANIKEYLPSELYERRRERAMEVIKTKKPVHFIDSRNERWLDNTFYPIVDDGEVKEIAVFTRDITEWKKMEEEVERNKNYFQTLVEKGWDVIMVHDKNTVIKYITPSVEKILGYKPSDVIGRKSIEFVHPDDMGLAMKLLEKILSHPKRTFSDNLRVKNAHGEWRIVEVSARNLLDNPAVNGIVVNYRDVTEEKIMEQALKESEERFRQVVESAQEWIWEVDERGLYTYSNNSIERILGYRPHEVVGKKYFYDFFHPDEKEKLKEMAFQIFKERKPFIKFLNRNIHRDGSERWLLTSGVPLLDRDGNLIGYRGVDTDVTELKKAEEEIKKLNQYLDSIIDNANVWLDVLDEEGNVVIWNKAAEKITGYSKEEVIGHKKIWEWLYPDRDYRNKIFNKAMDIIKGDVVEDFETIIRTKDGKRKIISWYSRNLVENGKIIGSIALGRDVTESKMMEREARKFKKIADSAQYGVVIIGGDGRIKYSNEYFAKVHDYSPKEVENKKISLFIEEKELEKLREMKDEIIRKGYLMPTEIWHKRKDGSTFPMLVAGTLMKDEATYMAVTYIDLTEKKRMEEVMKQNEKMAALGKLAAVVAHELNTPLANIGITADYLLSITEGHEKEIETIKKEVENASKIIKDVLGFSRIKIGEKTYFNLKDAMDEAIEKVRMMGGNEVIIQNRMDSCPFEGDKNRMMECFINIIKNAVMARDVNKPSHYVIIDCERMDGKIKIMVRDNGIGMEEEVLKEAMTPFFSTRPAGEGTGLGLFISNWIVEEHGGKIEIRSKKGEGTEVVIWLPDGVKNENIGG